MKPTQDKKLNNPTKRFFIIIVVSIVIIESFIMILFSYIHPPQFIELFGDSFLLAFLLSPVLYFFSYKPLTREHKKLTVAEKLLREANAGLENRVADRTKELKASEEKIRQITSTIPSAVYQYSLDKKGSQKFLFISPFAETLFGIPAEALQNDFNLAWTLVLPEDVEPLVQSIKIATESLKLWSHEFRIKDTHGNLKWIHGSSVYDKTLEDGAVIFNGFFTDVTAQKQAEAELIREHDRSRSIINASPSIVCGLNPDGMTNYINSTGEKLTGYSLSELLGRSWWDVFYPDSEYAQVEKLYRHFKTGEVHDYEMTLTTKAGEKKTISWSSVKQFDKNGKLTEILGFGNDVTEKRRAERRLSAQHAVTRVLAESSHLDKALHNVIQAICESLDWQEGAIWNLDAKSDSLRCADVWYKPSVGMKEFEEASRRMVFPQGVGLPGRIWESRKPAWILDVVKDSNFPRAPFASKAGLHSAFGLPIYFEDQLISIMEFFTSEIREPDDSLLRMMDAIGAQIGQFVRQKTIQEQLYQSQKMETIGTLAGGIAHNLNNQLTPVLGYVDIVLRQTKADDPAHPLLMEARQAGKRCVEIIQGLLIFSRPSTQQKTALNLSPVLEELKNMLPKFISSNIVMRIDYEKNIWMIQGHGTEIQSVLMNLSVNARDAMPHGGELSIKVRNADLTKGVVREGYSAGAYVCITVQDSGTGIPPALLQKIFEPFFTTKEKGKGTGLGLAMVSNIVKEHKGWVDVSSEVGKGTTFQIYLPALSEDQAQEKASEEVSSPVLPAGSETVLFADDEEHIRNMGRAFLQRLGYQVLLANDGEETVKLYETHKDKIAVVVLDMTMPKLTGRQTIQKILEINPKAKIILVSGYTSEGTSEELIQEGAVDFIQKPYTILPLSQVLRKVIDQGK